MDGTRLLVDIDGTSTSVTRVSTQHWVKELESDVKDIQCLLENLGPS